jgi:hypothetical protein
VEVELPGLIFDVYAVERQRVEVGIEPERGVGALDDGHRTPPFEVGRILDRAQTQLLLGSPAK